MPLPLTSHDKIILVDFDLELYKALHEKNVRPVALYYWFDESGKRQPHSDPCIRSFNVTREARFDWPERREYLKNPKYQEYIDEAFRQATSNSFYTRFFTRDWGRHSYHLVKRWSWLEMNNFIYKSLYYFLDLLVTKQINKIVFSDVPHQGAYVLLYVLAHVMKIDCIICFQSLFSNRFFVSSNAPFGKIFHPDYLTPPLAPISQLELPPVEVQFYMKRAMKRKSIQLVRFELFLKLLRRTLLLTWAVDPKAYKKTSFRFWRSLAPLPATRDPKLTSDFDPQKKYVYFPLHLQPEMTTDSLGGEYGDQLLALEKLRSILPDDWLIYCKENPKQRRHYMRGQDFLERLTSIPNVILVNDSSDSFELIRNSQFVATITGTAGWEAVRMGKKVLLYGDVWYQSLAGIYNSDAVKTVEDMELGTPVDQEELRQSFASLSSLLHAGCTKRGYEVLVENYDLNGNAQLIANSLCGG